MGIEKLSYSALREIIDNRVPLGCFYAYYGGVFVAVDNQTGEAWTECFNSLDSCKKWLAGEFEVGDK